MRILVFFCFLILVSCVNKEKVAPKDKSKPELNIIQDSTNLLIVQEETSSARSGQASYALNNQIYDNQFSISEDIIFVEGDIINITDTISTYDVGIFRGKWLKGHFEKHEFLIPSFCVINTEALKIPKLQLFDIIQKNENTISYRDEINNTFSSHEEIIFKNINDIEVIYFLTKAIYERENNKFPLSIEKEGKMNDYLEISFVETKEGLEALELKWLFDGGDLIISFKKIPTGGVMVIIDESFG